MGTRESLCIGFSGKMLLGKKRGGDKCVYIFYFHAYHVLRDF